MSFVDKTILRKLIGDKLVSQFEATNPDVLDTEIIIFADTEITRITGIQPPADPVATPPSKTLQMWASWLMLYVMMPYQTLTRDETDLRTSRYNKAMEGLAAYQGVTLSSTYTPPTVQISNVKRVGDIP